MKSSRNHLQKYFLLISAGLLLGLSARGELGKWIQTLAAKTAAEQAFFETISRPDQLATSEASVQNVMLHALRTVEARSSFHADALAVIYGNVPVRPDDAIDRAAPRNYASRQDEQDEQHRRRDQKRVQAGLSDSRFGTRSCNKTE